VGGVGGGGLGCRNKVLGEGKIGADLGVEFDNHPIWC